MKYLQTTLIALFVWLAVLLPAVVSTCTQGVWAPSHGVVYEYCPVDTIGVLPSAALGFFQQLGELIVPVSLLLLAVCVVVCVALYRMTQMHEALPVFDSLYLYKLFRPHALSLSRGIVHPKLCD